MGPLMIVGALAFGVIASSLAIAALVGLSAAIHFLLSGGS